MHSNNIIHVWFWNILLLPQYEKKVLKCTNSHYLSALDACNSPVLNIGFDELDFQSISNWNFTGYSRQKNLVQNRGKKSGSSNLIFQLENFKKQVQIERGTDS
jgi:hypothetical protein